jgi:serine/threonine protein kinase
MAQVMEAVASGWEDSNVAWRSNVCCRNTRATASGGDVLRGGAHRQRLHHGGIVPIFDYGLIDGSEFLAMEYVDGLDALRAVMRLAAPASSRCRKGSRCTSPPRSRTPSPTFTILRDDDERPLAIVHRDVSPPNILLSWNGDVKLSDFGIALAR